jgi:hypothetical protein
MSPLRRRKRRSSRARTRRQELVERERLQYGREQVSEQPEEVAEAPRPDRGRAPRAGRKERRSRLGGLRQASAGGARATVRHARPGVRRIFGGVGRALGWLVAWVLRLAELVERATTGLLGGIVGAGQRALAFAERYVTPERVLVVVIGGAAGCLGVSQFVAYRGVEVGQPQYSDVSTIAPPPQTDRIDAGAAHAYVLVPWPRSPL